MAITIKLHPSLQQFADNQAVISVVDDLTANELLTTISHTYPKLKPYLLNSNGDINNFINVYINGQDLRYTKSDTTINSDDRIEILTALAGG